MKELAKQLIGDIKKDFMTEKLKHDTVQTKQAMFKSMPNSLRTSTIKSPNRQKMTTKGVKTIKKKEKPNYQRVSN